MCPRKHPVLPPPDPYPILRVLGSGGLGLVSLTADPWSGRPLAIKQAINTDHARARLCEEFDLLSALQLPTLPACGRIGVQADGAVYLTMERVVGRRVMSVVRAAGAPGTPKRQTRVRSILRRLLRALMTVHHHGVVHGDIKAGNMAISPCGAIRLMDLGAARRLDPHTRHVAAPRFMGTQRYAAPEQRRRGTMDVRSDLFSVGALAVRLLTDEKPDWPPKPPDNITDAQLRVLLDALLEPDPQNRPGTASTALQMLAGPPPAVAQWWDGSAGVCVEASAARRSRRLQQWQAAAGDHRVHVVDGAALLGVLQELRTPPPSCVLIVSELHMATPQTRRLLSRWLYRALRHRCTVHLRATSAPDPTLRASLPSVQFTGAFDWQPATATGIHDLEQCLRLLDMLSGADPLIAAERPLVALAADCWQALGQRGEAAHLRRTLRAFAPGPRPVIIAEDPPSWAMDAVEDTPHRPEVVGGWQALQRRRDQAS